MTENFESFSLAGNLFSPVVLTSEWENAADPDTGATGGWKATFRRLWFFPSTGGYEVVDWNEEEHDIYAPLSSKEKLDNKKGDRLFAVFRGRWEVFEGGGDSRIWILHGKLDSALGENAATVNVKPDDDGEVITVKLPSYRIQQQSAGTKCRYFKTAGGFEMLDTDCGD